MQKVFTLMGAQFRPADAKDALAEAQPGDTVFLEPDGDNEYDPHAIEVYLEVGSENYHIGFLPRGNAELFDYLTEGGELTAEIVAFESRLKPVIQIAL